MSHKGDEAQPPEEINIERGRLMRHLNWARRIQNLIPPWGVRCNFSIRPTYRRERNKKMHWVK